MCQMEERQLAYYCTTVHTVEIVVKKRDKKKERKIHARDGTTRGLYSIL